MKLKTFTFTALFLFFLVEINAQSTNIQSSSSNGIDITLLVEDIERVQKFSLVTNDNHYYIPENELYFNVKLNFLSDLNNVTYYRFKYSFSPINFDGIIGDPVEPLMGITVPVIIPPVRKKRNSSFRPVGEYPYFIVNEFPLLPKNYRVVIDLLRYNNFQDYWDGNDNYTFGPKAIFTLLEAPDPIPVANMDTTNSFAVTTYPNPSADHITIEYTNTVTENASLQNIPIQLTIFNRTGVRVSSHDLISFETKKNSLLYNLNTAHLPKGMYYCQIKHGKKTYVKTIIKR